MPKPNSNVKLIGPAFIKAGNHWISLVHVASIYMAPNDGVVIHTAGGQDIRLDGQESREFRNAFDAITKEFETP